MGYKRDKFEQKGFDEEEYQSYFQKNQAEYIRTKLRSVHLYWQGRQINQIAHLLGINHKSVRLYLKVYQEGGFRILCQPTLRPQASQLTQAGTLAFRAVLLSKRPFEVSLSSGQHLNGQAYVPVFEAGLPGGV